jgi:hypothetical protein
MDAVTSFYLAHAFWVWIALGALLLAIEVLSGSGWLLWPAATAAVVAFLAQFADLTPGQAVLVFVLLTISSVLLARRYLPKSLLHHGDQDINDNIGRLVGHRGRAVTPFRGRAGRVFIDGKEWAAELDEGEMLEVGSTVEVTGVAGAHLRVRSA